VFQSDIARIRQYGYGFDGRLAGAFISGTRQFHPASGRRGDTHAQGAAGNSKSKWSALSGMFVNVNLHAPLGRQLTIPASSVFQSGTRAFVDRGGGYFEPREVETGDRAGDDLVVLKLQAAMGSFAPPPPGAGAAASMNTTGLVRRRR